MRLEFAGPRWIDVFLTVYAVMERVMLAICNVVRDVRRVPNVADSIHTVPSKSGFDFNPVISVTTYGIQLYPADNLRWDS